MVRGEAAGLAMTGELSRRWRKFPAGPYPSRPGSSPGPRRQGNISFKLKLKRTAGPAEMFLCGRGRLGAGKAGFKNADGEYAYFEAAAPFSAYYVSPSGRTGGASDPVEPISPALGCACCS